MREADVAIVGGGAAGLAAAIVAARAGASVTVLEATSRVGQKILKTGNGRCNITNMHARPEDYNDPACVATVLDAYSPQRVLEFFESLGLMTTEEREGRAYPFSNAATSVLDVLRDACARLGVSVDCDKSVTGIERAHDGFSLVCADGSALEARRVIVATGGATRLLECLGHRIEPFEPVLCPVKTEMRALKGLSGVRAHVIVRAYDDERPDAPFFEEAGEVQFRDYGLSGIVIFDLSRFVKPDDRIRLDFLAGMPAGEFASWLERRHSALVAESSARFGEPPSYAELMCGCFHPRVNNAVVRAVGLKPSQQVDAAQLPLIAQAAAGVEVRARGFVAASAQVTRGGACMDEFDSATLESKIAPGLYAAGETLNVDGRCGGFNLQWAWASGLAAGVAAASCE